MKKLLFIAIALIMINSIGFAQETAEKKTTASPKFFLAFTAGPAVPVGAFASKSVSETSDAGLANLGYNLNLHTGYQVSDYFGITGNVLYSRFQLNQDAVNRYLNSSGSGALNSTADHWQYWGVIAGPMATLPVGNDVFFDFKAMGGYARANMPVIGFQIGGLPSGAQTPEKWSDVFAWQFGTNMRYNFAKNACLYANLDYNHMEPTWKFTFLNENFALKQKMGVIDFTVGVGLTF